MFYCGDDPPTQSHEAIANLETSSSTTWKNTAYPSRGPFSRRDRRPRSLQRDRAAPGKSQCPSTSIGWKMEMFLSSGRRRAPLARRAIRSAVRRVACRRERRGPAPDRQHRRRDLALPALSVNSRSISRVPDSGKWGCRDFGSRSRGGSGRASVDITTASRSSIVEARSIPIALLAHSPSRPRLEPGTDRCARAVSEQEIGLVMSMVPARVGRMSRERS